MKKVEGYQPTDTLDTTNPPNSTKEKKHIIYVDPITWMLQFNNEGREGNCNDIISFHDARWDNSYTILVEHTDESIKNWLESTGVSREILNKYSLLNHPNKEEIFNLKKFDMMSYAIPRWYPNKNDENHGFTMETTYFINSSEITKAFEKILKQEMEKES